MAQLGQMIQKPPIQVENPATQIIPESKPKKSNFWIWVLVILLIVAIGLGVYYWYF